MRVLFDNGTPKAIPRCLGGHQISYARQIGWHELKNGELLTAAEQAGFDVLLTTDKNIQYQQNLTRRKISNIVLGNSQWPRVRRNLDRISSAVNGLSAGSYIEVEIPFE